MPNGPHSAWSTAAHSGPATAQAVETILASRPHPQQGSRACLGIMRLGKSYGDERLEAACRRALTLEPVRIRVSNQSSKRALIAIRRTALRPHLPPAMPISVAPSTTKRPRRTLMLHHPTLDKLQALRLHGMYHALVEQMQMPEIATLSFEERLGLLVDRELTEREDRRLTTRLRQAKLRQAACLEDLDYRQPRGWTKP